MPRPILDDAHSVAPDDDDSDCGPVSPTMLEDVPSPWELPLGLLRQLYLGSDGATRTVSVERAGSPYDRRDNTANGRSPPSAPIASKEYSSPLSPGTHSAPAPAPDSVALAPSLSLNSQDESSSVSRGARRSLSMRSSPSVQRRLSARRSPATGRSVLSSTAQHRPNWGSSQMGPASRSQHHHHRGISAESDQLQPEDSDRLRLVTYTPAQRAPYLPTRALNFSDKRRVLVTGGAGFVGSHLVDRLMLMGHEVLVVDNFFTGIKANISHWVGHPSFEVVRHDVVNSLLVEVDQIYHLACPASPKAYQVNPVKTIKTSFQGTLNMLGLAKRTKSRFLLASTSEVYGDPSVHPQPESYHGNVNQTGPRGCYDEGKRIAETLTYGYFYQDEVDVRVARIFNTYGPRMHPYDGRVVSNFILQGLKGEPLTVYGDGQQTRSFMFIHDLIDGLIALMEAEPDTELPDLTEYASDQDEPELGVHGPVNLGNMGEFTIKELVRAVAEAIHQVRVSSGRPAPAEKPKLLDAPEGSTRENICGLEIVYCPMPTDDPQKRRPDTGRAQALLNWHPRWSLKEGLLEMVHYYQQKIDGGEL